ncbi:vWA domain-containing protein [Microbulbifer sp. JTAC008]|uniref:vWA domain-containing protein n=1 Tax=unclassified Microbulbifer TaxID=2619833 RepID=UPI004039DC09
MSNAVSLEKGWARFILALQREFPFFAVLAMFARLQFDNEVEISKIDGRALRVSPQFFLGMEEHERHGYLLHQVLHLALGHPHRGTGRDPLLWNMAADIVVNNILTEETSWPVPPTTAWDGRFAGYSVERVYARLLKDRPKDGGQGGDGVGDDPIANYARVLVQRYRCHDDFSPQSGSQATAEQAYWQGALVKARQLPQNSKSAGTKSSSLKRETEIVIGGQLDWRSLLWKYATPAANDYEEFDRRFLHRSLYLEHLQSEDLPVEVVVDTSGSICGRTLSRFLEELFAVHQCHPNTRINFYYADVALHGPYGIPQDLSDFPVPIGAGGTSFTTYFSDLEKRDSLLEQPVAVLYFSDGFGTFPNTSPSIPVLWLLTEDGQEDEQIPFGTVVRIKV